MNRIGILGGTFDPPTFAHLQLAMFALGTDKVDQVWLVPCWEHAFGKQPSKFEDRDKMCRLAVEAVFGKGPGCKVDVKPYEALWKIHYTVDLVERLIKQYPDFTFTLILGADNLRDAAKWHHWEDILLMTDPPIIVGRPGVTVEGYVPDFECLPISSTMVREAAQLENYGDCKQWAPAAVIQYFTESYLYRKSESR
jgi:nicotinate-nucleotide adenylyltransferase